MRELAECLREECELLNVAGDPHEVDSLQAQRARRFPVRKWQNFEEKLFHFRVGKVSHDEVEDGDEWRHADARADEDDALVGKHRLHGAWEWPVEDENQLPRDGNSPSTASRPATL